MTYLRPFIALQNKPQSPQINKRKDVLRALNVVSVISQLVQLAVNPDMRAGIDERACGAGDFGVVALALEVEGDLLHVGRPVNFSVFEFN